MTVSGGRTNLVGTEEAARLLGVTPRRIQQLSQEGRLVSPARGLVDRASLDRLLATHAVHEGRAWHAATAWGAIALLADEGAPWLGERQRLRLLGTLRGLTAHQFVGKARSRARVRTFGGHRAVAGRLAEAVITTDREQLGLGGATGLDVSVEGYVAEEVVPRLVSRLALVEDPSGPYVLRVTDFDIEIVRTINGRSDVLAAVDAAESLDPRERGVGEAALRRALERLRG